MRWLKRKLRAWLRSDELDEAVMVKSSSPDYHEDGMIRFVLTPAIGGRILRVTREVSYNKSSNSLGSSRDNENVTYIIPSGEDVGERVSKIINLELLK